MHERLPAGNWILDDTFPIVIFEEVRIMLTELVGITGRFEVRFTSPITMDGYAPLSAGRMGGLAVRLIAMEEAWTLVTLLD